MIGSSHSPIISICSLLLLFSPAAMAQSEAAGISPAPITLSSVEPPATPSTNSSASSVEQVCRQIDEKLGSVDYDDCVSLNLGLSGAISINQTPIVLKEYGPLPGRLPKGRVLLLGGVHGDEYSSISIVFRWMETLEKHHSGLFHWRVAPLVNPDGLLKEKSTRTNANGVDINRNFPTPDWNESALKYWESKTSSNPRNYPGAEAESEPETAWVVKQIEEFDPDVIVSVHAPHGVVDYDGPEDGPYKLGRLYLNLLGTFPGSLGKYAGVQKNIPVVTIELPYAGIMPSPAEISNIWTDLVRWLTGNIPAEQPVAQETDPS